MSDDPTRDQPTGFDADRDPVEVALAAVAAMPVTVGPERLAALEARVMGAAVDRDDRGAVVALGSTPVRSVGRWSRGRSMLSAAAVLLVVALGALTVVLLAGDDDALAIAAADRVVVELPDGESVVGEAGTELPDGTRLEVIGFVEIDGRRFGPGSYRIVDGEVVRSELDEPAATSDMSEGPDGGGSDPSRPAPADGDGVEGDGAERDEEEGDGSVRTTVVGGARSDDEPEEPAPDDGRDGTVAPRPTDPPRTTTPLQTPDITRPPAPVRQDTVPARPATSIPPERPTTTSTTTTARTTTSTTTTSTTTTSTTTTSTTTTVPTRTNAAGADGESRPARP